MSNQGSTDLLDLVDVGDLLDTLGDEVDAAVAAALVTSPSLDNVENEQGVHHLKGETEGVPHGAGAVEVAEEREKPREEEQQEHQRQGDDKAEAEEEQEPRGRTQQPKHVDVDIDSTPLSVQQGYDRFRQLEILREEQKKEMQMKEEQEKGKPAYSGKKWVVKQPAGPLRPQEAGQLKVACAVKAGVEKMSPREEIDKLTREEAERKKKEKELAAAAGGPSYVPTKPSLNSEATKEEGNAKEEETAKEEGAGEEERTAKEEDGAKEGEAAPMGTTALEEGAAAEGNKEGEAEATAAAGTDQDGDRDEEKQGDKLEGKTLEAGNLERPPTGLQDTESNAKPALTATAHESPQDEKLEHADAARKANASKPKKKIFYLFSCFSKKGRVTEPRKPPGKKRTSTAEHAEASSTGEMSETFHVEHKGIHTVPPFAEPVFDD